jgi:hypothetical protein
MRQCRHSTPCVLPCGERFRVRVPMEHSGDWESIDASEVIAGCAGAGGDGEQAGHTRLGWVATGAKRHRFSKTVRRVGRQR